MKYALLVLAILIIAILGYVGYSGIFSSVKVEEKEIGPYQLAFIERYGDYSKSGKFIDSIRKIIEKQNVKYSETFGIYYDNPQRKKVDSLHSIIGCILNEADSLKFAELTRNGIRIEKMGQTKAMVAEFPFRTSLSIMFGIMKAYPAINEYAASHNFQLMPSMEIYSDGKILYTMEISPKR